MPNGTPYPAQQQPVQAPFPFAAQSPGMLPQQMPQMQAQQPAYPQPGMQVPIQQMPQPMPQQQQMPPQQAPAAPGFDFQSWAQQNQINPDDYGGPEALAGLLLNNLEHTATLEQQVQQSQQATQAQQPASKWQDWESQLAYGQDGKITARPGQEMVVPYQVIIDANQEQDSRRETMNGFTANPQEKMQEWLSGGDWLNEQVDARVNSILEQQKHSDSIDSFLNSPEHAWLYEADQNGNRQHSPAGQRLMQIANGLQESGSPPADIFRQALQSLELETFQQVRDMQATQQQATQQQAMQQQAMQQQAMQQQAAQQQHNQNQPQFPFGTPPQQQEQQQEQQQQAAPMWAAPVGHAQASPAPPQNDASFWQNRGVMDPSTNVHPGAYGSESRTIPQQADSEIPDANDIIKNEMSGEGMSEQN